MNQPQVTVVKCVCLGDVSGSPLVLASLGGRKAQGLDLVPGAPAIRHVAAAGGRPLVSFHVWQGAAQPINQGAPPPARAATYANASLFIVFASSRMTTPAPFVARWLDELQHAGASPSKLVVLLCPDLEPSPTAVVCEEVSEARGAAFATCRNGP